MHSPLRAASLTARSPLAGGSFARSRIGGTLGLLAFVFVFVAVLGASMLIIEHDMPFIMGMSDRVYCLEQGRVIAEGDPVTVRNDPSVVASYLGMDERTIARSGSTRVSPSRSASVDPRARPRSIRTRWWPRP